MKNFRIILVLTGLLVLIIGYTIHSFSYSLNLTKSLHWELVFYAILIGGVFIIFGITLIIAKFISDKLNIKQ